jgi:cytochrome c peroxidase
VKRLLLFASLAAGAAAQDAKPAPVFGPQLPAALYNYARPELPFFYLQPGVANLDNTPSFNLVSDEGATLGRVLFYDTALSRNRALACGSCHRPETGFADAAALSHGFAGGFTRRHSMGISNARYYRSGRFFWDERAQSLEAQVLMPIQDGVEMGLTLDQLVERVSAAPYYAALFQAAFGDPRIDVDRISRALAQFVRSLVSYRSRYDAGRALVASNNQPFPNFSDEENLGKQVYFDGGRTGCNTCHGGDAFIAPGPRNNGLDATTTDAGVGGVTGQTRDAGRFKVPSLRNVGLRAPYMHDGRFATLEEVIEHYNSGVQNHPNLDNPLRRNGSVRRLNLSDEEKRALVAFLHTLSDYELALDPKFSNPFPGR